MKQQGCVDINKMLLLKDMCERRRERLKCIGKESGDKPNMSQKTAKI